MRIAGLVFLVAVLVACAGSQSSVDAKRPHVISLTANPAAADASATERGASTERYIVKGDCYRCCFDNVCGLTCCYDGDPPGGGGGGGGGGADCSKEKCRSTCPSSPNPQDCNDACSFCSYP